MISFYRDNIRFIAKNHHGVTKVTGPKRPTNFPITSLDPIKNFYDPNLLKLVPIHYNSQTKAKSDVSPNQFLLLIFGQQYHRAKLYQSGQETKFVGKQFGEVLSGRVIFSQFHFDHCENKVTKIIRVSAEIIIMVVTCGKRVSD